MRKGRNRIGSLSLVVALIGFLLLVFQPWIPLDRLVLFRGLSLKGLLVAFFSASLVGALADWFAVSALFKNPLGIKLPHTDILAKNKDAIAEAVPRFLTSFVTEEKMALELARVDFAAKAQELLGRVDIREQIRDFVRARISSLLAGYGTLEIGRVEAIETFIKELFAFVGERLDSAAGFAAFLRWARREAFDERIIEGLATFLRIEIGRNRTRLAAAITPIIKQNAGWQGIFVGQGTVERLLYGVGEVLECIRADRHHELRRFLAGSLDSYAARIAGEVPDLNGDRERFRVKVRSALTDESFQTSCAGFVAGLLGRLGADLTRPGSSFIEALERTGNALEAQLGRTGEFRERFNRGVSALILGFVTRSRIVDGLTAYLSSLMKTTDERDFVRRVEDAVWNDLQYIRVNGAVVGGLVGLVISLVGAFLPG